MIVRKATEKDLDSICKIENETSTIPWTRESISKNLVGENGAHCYVTVSDDGRVLGYAAMWLVLDDAQITNLSVIKEWRRKGLACALIDYMAEDAKQLGACILSLEVSEHNTAAINLYEKKYFTRSGVRKNYYGKSGGDAIIMLRKIEN